jgi:hypothetical protein
MRDKDFTQIKKQFKIIYIMKINLNGSALQKKYAIFCTIKWLFHVIHHQGTESEKQGCRLRQM